MASDTRGARADVAVEELARFVASRTFENVPADAVRTAERCFVDTVGVALAGAHDGAGEVAARVAEMTGSTSGSDATLVGHDERATVAGAALVNGTAAHGIDFDDVSDGMGGHPSAPMAPALLAIAESVDATGEELLTAYVAGFETQCYLAAPLLPAHYEAGWHATATFGTFGAAAGAANLLGLNEDQTRHALNIAASTPSGLKRNFGTMTKPMHCGHAARSGVTAAFLAAEGFTADADAIGGTRGFFDLYAGAEPADLGALYELGSEWAILEDDVDIKKYPCCYFTHTSIDIALALAGSNDVDPEDVRSVRVTASQGAKDVLVHDEPTSGLEGKFSMHYTVASAIARGDVGIDAFEDDRIDEPVVRRLGERVSFGVDPDIAYDSFGAMVSIETSDGTYTDSREYAPGSHHDPLPSSELEEKFVSCARRSIDDDHARRLYDRLDDLRSEPSVASLGEHL